ncbi:RNA polymerase sigma factor [Maribellus maritimus]|uniref:RNA polymerase sigma factor n=1 Tax=Maribellus maritimus TaxID=2870838 RepID=UPI001EEAAC16|nr:RNA polymerase sigma-70 factor [Maribellus maritimus]MCG6190145.1 RNA polymerase sigma-70 factor [Maribellus maritimus]
MKVTKTNKELLSLLRTGDRVAFYNIYEKYSKRIYAFVYRYIKQEEDAEEIVQEVFVKIWNLRETIDENSSFDSYLFTIAYNTTINLFRKRLREKKYLENLKSLQQITASPDIIDEIQFSELDATIQNLLNRLTPRQKEIFQLSREEGLTHSEIAEKLGISVNTVKKHITNTLSFLKSHLTNQAVICLLFVYLFL